MGSPLEHLPGEDRREWLLDRLADLCEWRGYAPLVTAPLLEPSDRFFPDRWTDTPASVARLARRLLAYAGLGDLGVMVHVVDDRTPEQRHGRLGASAPHRRVAAWFAGIEDDTCLFGVFRGALHGADDLVGALCHEVAHAWRRANGVEVADRDSEEKLTDLTTIHLGMGILTTNASYRYRAGAVEEGPTKGHTWSHRTLGYLDPVDMSFLLAAQCHVRGLERAELRRIANSLEVNQGAYFRAALAHFEDSDEALASRLGIPSRDEWPAPPDLEALTGPLEDSEEIEEDLDGDGDDSETSHSRAEPARLPAAGRVLAARVSDQSIPLTIAGFVAGIAAEAAFGSYGFSLIAAVPFGWWLGRRKKTLHCPTRGCSAAVLREGESCATCGAIVFDEDHPWT
jgi:hypothetical protein